MAKICINMSSQKWKHCNITNLNCHIDQSVCTPTSKLCIKPNMLNTYSTKAEELLQWKATKYDKNTRNPTLYGIELEVECFPATSEYSNIINDFNPWDNPNHKATLNPAIIHNAKIYYWSQLLKHTAILKSDGSLLLGIEIVTPPQTYYKMINTLTTLGSLFKENENICSLHTSSRCGYHIHMAKPSILIIKKLLALYASFSLQQLELIGRRPPNTYCRPVSIDKRTLSMQKGGYTTDKYKSIHTGKANTIEFRLFASTTKTEILLSALEFVKASVDFCTETSWIHITTKNFFDYITKNKKEYPNAFYRMSTYTNTKHDDEKQIIKSPPITKIDVNTLNKKLEQNDINNIYTSLITE